MRRLGVALAVLMGLVPLVLAQGSGVSCKLQGLHMCCKDCEKTVKNVLGRVGGLSEVVCDRPSKVVTFKARSEKVADEAVSELVDAGFYFQVTIGERRYPLAVKPTHIKSNPLVVRNVHVCCEDCEKSIEKLFANVKVTFEGRGPVMDVTLSGRTFDADYVLQTLHEAGLHGVCVGNAQK